MKHHVSTKLVGRIIRKAKNNSTFLKQRIEKEKKRSVLVEMVKRQFLQRAQDSVTPATAGWIQSQMQVNESVSVPRSTILGVLKKELGLSYK